MAYTKINFENFPSVETPINAENLNKMDERIFDIGNGFNAIEIPANADLNTYTTPGVYNAESDTIARTISNMPTSGDSRVAFSLEVIRISKGKDSFCQRVTYYVPRESSPVFVRTKIGSWGSWSMVFNTKNCPMTKAYTGYQKLASGLIIQWGNSKIPIGSVSTTVTYPVALTIGTYPIITQAHIDNKAYTNGISNKKFTINIPTAQNMDRYFGWIVIGY